MVSKLVNKLYYVLIILVVGVLLSFYYGWAFSVMWGWFVVPSLHLTPLTTNQGTGLMSVLWFSTGHITMALYNKPDDPDKSIAAIFGVLFSPLVALFFGWIILQLSQ